MIHLARRTPALPKRDRPLIFIVDDSVDMLKLYALILERAQIGTVTCFSNPETALVAINEQRPDMVLSDLAMPGMWGTELYEQVFTHRANRAIRWIFMSPSGSHLADAHRYKADAFLPLPCNPRDLIEMIRRVLPTRFHDSQPEDST